MGGTMRIQAGSMRRRGGSLNLKHRRYHEKYFHYIILNVLDVRKCYILVFCLS